MNILITGSEGSLAQIVIPKLLENGHNIIGADNFYRHGQVERKRDYAFEKLDLTDSSGVTALFKKHDIDAVFHTAAIVYGVIGFHKKPADIIVDNNLMTMNLLKHGAKQIRKFIYLSSSMVYESCTVVPHKEEDANKSVVMSTSYGLSKYISERVVRSFNEQYGTVYTIWRPFNIVTPFEEPEEVGFSHVFADLTRKIIAERQNPLEILGDGNQVRCFTSIYDVAEAICNFSLDKRSDNDTFNIGNPEPITIKELVQLIIKICKEEKILPNEYSVEYKHLPIYKDDVKMRIPDVSKMEKLFNWKAKIKVRESLQQYIKRFYE